MRSCYKAFSHLLISCVCVAGAAPVGGATLGLVVPGSVRKQAEQIRGNKPSSTASDSAPPLGFLLHLSSCPDFLWS